MTIDITMNTTPFGMLSVEAQAARTACEIQPECRAGLDRLWPNNGDVK